VELLASFGAAELSLGQDTQQRVSTPPDAPPWSVGRFKKAMDEYHADHEYLRLDPEARNTRHTYITPADDQKTWRVQQMWVDPENHNDWLAEFNVDLAQSREVETPVMTLLRIGPLN
jgi:hypothetical protein